MQLSISVSARESASLWYFSQEGGKRKISVRALEKLPKGFVAGGINDAVTTGYDAQEE